MISTGNGILREKRIKDPYSWEFHRVVDSDRIPLGLEDIRQLLEKVPRLSEVVMLLLFLDAHGPELLQQKDLHQYPVPDSMLDAFNAFSPLQIHQMVLDLQVSNVQKVIQEACGDIERRLHLALQLLLKERQPGEGFKVKGNDFAMFLISQNREFGSLFWWDKEGWWNSSLLEYASLRSFTKIMLLVQPTEGEMEKLLRENDYLPVEKVILVDVEGKRIGGNLFSKKYWKELQPGICFGTMQSPSPITINESQAISNYFHVNTLDEGEKASRFHEQESKDILKLGMLFGGAVRELPKDVRNDNEGYRLKLLISRFPTSPEALMVPPVWQEHPYHDSLFEIEAKEAEKWNVLAYLISEQGKRVWTKWKENVAVRLRLLDVRETNFPFSQQWPEFATRYLNWQNSYMEALKKWTETLHSYFHDTTPEKEVDFSSQLWVCTKDLDSRLDASSYLALSSDIKKTYLEIARLEPLKNLAEISQESITDFKGEEGFLTANLNDVNPVNQEIVQGQWIKREEISPRLRRIARPGDLLIQNLGAAIGEGAIVPNEYTKLLVSTAFTVLRPKLMPRLLYLYFQHPLVERQFRAGTVGVTQMVVPDEVWGDILIVRPKDEESLLLQVEEINKLWIISHNQFREVIEMANSMFMK